MNPKKSKNLNETFNELTVEISKNFVFYVPMALVNNKIFYEFIDQNNIEIDYEIASDYIDTLLFIDRNLEIEINPNVDSLNLISLKFLKLSENCFNIIELKDVTKIETFNFLFQKYIIHLKNFTKFAEMLIFNFDEYSPTYIQNLKPQFLQQHHFLELHSQEIENLIANKIMNETKTEMIPKEIMNLDLKIKKISPKVISKQEAIDYLLKNVFKTKTKF